MLAYLNGEPVAQDIRQVLRNARKSRFGCFFRSLIICIPIRLHAPPLIQGRSRMRRRARTDLRGGRRVVDVPTATTIRFSGTLP